MRLKTVSRIMLTLLLVSTLVLTFCLRQTKSLEPPDIEWSKTYGGSQLDIAWAVVQTSDGGYALAGWTESYGYGECDVWLVKVDSTGTLQWSKTFGGVLADEAFSIVESKDGGYALAGSTGSYGAGGDDAWLVKTDWTGNVQWNRTYGGASSDYAHSVVETSDGGYALAGRTFSFGTKGFWLVKTDSSGNLQWNQTYEGTPNDIAFSMIQSNDGGYALAGVTFGVGGNIRFAKTDATGNMQWNKRYGGSGVEGAQSIIQTNDGGYALAGYTDSYGAGNKDFWLIKIAEPPKYTLTIHSSPSGTTFTVDSISHMAPWSGNYSDGTSVSLVMHKTHDGYVWSHWLEDGDPNRIKTVTMDTNITLTGVYAPTPEPVGGKATPINVPMNKPGMPTLWIWLIIIILSLAATVVYVKKRKRNTEINS